MKIEIPDGKSVAPHDQKSASNGVCSFVATVALDCSSSVDHGEDSYQVRGQCQSPLQCLSGSLDRARRDLETAFTKPFYELCRRGLVILLHPLLKGLPHMS